MFSGSMVAIVTPMTADGDLDWPAWDRLLDFHMHEGSDGIVIAGTTGESPALAAAEIEELTRRAVARCQQRVKVIVGAGTNATESTVARTRSLSRLGVDAVMLVTPYYNKPPQEGLYRHFSAAADASAAPIILYNVPSRTAVDLLPSTIARLARHSRIVAVKEATAASSRAREILSLCPAEFTVLSGDDASAIDLMSVGARGVISVSANVAPRRMHEACAAALSGDWAGARAIDACLQPLHKDLFVESSPIPVKWAVARMGLIGNTLRPPLVELSSAHQETVLRAMRAAGVTLEDQAA
ncbi:MAG TPA: 4-hydroxy-tetrahydrodipicolinate synthase [Steroidobacteraceae bacterium]|jgi:4-hydroxy-tetrahydrodipicolinate synthase|nr:4-hydroxy-tetrahydrodipicolinate synthase [Steroidobacteraceae bacterium]